MSFLGKLKKILGEAFKILKVGHDVGLYSKEDAPTGPNVKPEEKVKYPRTR